MSVASLGFFSEPVMFVILNVHSALVGNTDQHSLEGEHWIAMYIDANSKGEYYDPMGLPPYQAAYVAFLNKCIFS
jgi:hypothetical protein